MERRDNGHKKKRARDEAADHHDKKECRKGKKPELTITCLDRQESSSSSSFYKDKGYGFCDPVGVFDFPWLKEGAIFEVDELLEPQDMFGPCSYVDQGQDIFVDQPKELIHDDKFDNLCSFQVDDLEPLDCIWSSVIDQPLDNIGFNKA